MLIPLLTEAQGYIWLMLAITLNMKAAWLDSTTSRCQNEIKIIFLFTLTHAQDGFLDYMHIKTL